MGNFKHSLYILLMSITVLFLLHSFTLTTSQRVESGNRNTGRQALDVDTIDLSGTKNPMQLFYWWRQEATAFRQNVLPNTMTICTVKADGTPAARTVLLRGFDNRGFQIYTDYKSAKAKDIDNNPNVALVFLWSFTRTNGVIGNRQVRVEGVAEKLPIQESKNYFNTEPRLAQIRAMIQHQSARISDNRNSLLNRASQFLNLVNKDPGVQLVMPGSWGGYLIRPKTIEFYQGTRDALNDRVKFFKNDNPRFFMRQPGVTVGEDGWYYEQLEP